MPIKTDRELLQDIHTKLTVMETKCVGCHAKIAGHDRELYGNGKMGLKLKTEIMWWGLDSVMSFLVLGGGLL